MNYLDCYNSLVNKCVLENRSKNNGIYYELHHIVPKCLGGNNDDSNLVLFSGREHFLAHWLLAKIYPLNFSIQCAWNAFCLDTNGKRPVSRLYEYARLNFIKALEINKAERNKKNSETHKNMKWINNGIITTKVSKEKAIIFVKNGWSYGRLYFKRSPHSIEHKEKISRGNTGKIMSDELKEIHRKNSLGRVWINNGIEEKMIKNDLLLEFLNNGWEKGRKKNE